MNSNHVCNCWVSFNLPFLSFIIHRETILYWVFKVSVNISDLNPSQFLIAIHLKLHLLHRQRHTCMVPVNECQHLIFRLLGKLDPDSVWVIDVPTPTLGIGIEQKITTIHKLDLLIIRPRQMRIDSIQLGFEWRLYTRGPCTFGPKVQFIWLVWTQPFLACAWLKRWPPAWTTCAWARFTIGASMNHAQDHCAQTR